MEAASCCPCHGLFVRCGDTSTQLPLKAFHLLCEMSLRISSCISSSWVGEARAESCLAKELRRVCGMVKVTSLCLRSIVNRIASCQRIKRTEVSDWTGRRLETHNLAASPALYDQSGIRASGSAPIAVQLVIGQNVDTHCLRAGTWRGMPSHVEGLDVRPTAEEALLMFHVPKWPWLATIATGRDCYFRPCRKGVSLRIAQYN